MYDIRNLRELEIDHIIALCYIINDYPDFYKKIKKESSVKDKLRLLKDFERFQKGKSFMISKKIKDFYISNKKIIDIINEHTDFYYFIFCNYSYKETNIIEREGFKNIREYIEKNKEQVDKIITLLEKLKELGFEYIMFDAKSNFPEQIYSISTKGFHHHVFSWVSNIKMLPGYDANIFYYMTNNSPYRIDLSTDFDTKFVIKRIVLNSLIFNINELPNSLSKEDTFDKIVEQGNKLKMTNDAIRNSVSLENGILGLEEEYQKLCEIVQAIKKSDSTFANQREKVKKILLQIKTSIELLREESTLYDEQVISAYQEISLELLGSEKKRYLKMKTDMQQHLH